MIIPGLKLEVVILELYSFNPKTSAIPALVEACFYFTGQKRKDREKYMAESSEKPAAGNAHSMADSL